MARTFIATHYPWFLETFEGYKYPIQRADSIRYFVLYHYGGIYIDLDDVSHTDQHSIPSGAHGTQTLPGLQPQNRPLARIPSRSPPHRPNRNLQRRDGLHTTASVLPQRHSETTVVRPQFRPPVSNSPVLNRAHIPLDYVEGVYVDEADRNGSCARLDDTRIQASLVELLPASSGE
jgi:hypothetical protein